MTGFGKVTAELPSKKVTVEIKALNSKQLDLSTVSLPYTRIRKWSFGACYFNLLEPGEKSLKFPNIFIEYIGKDTPTQINLAAVENYYNQIKVIAEKTEYQRSERLVPDLAPDAGRNQVRDRRTGRIRMGGGFRNGKGRYQAPV